MFKLEFETGNAAFEGDNLAFEVADILQDLVVMVQQGRREGIVRDSNGNQVGKWSLQPEA